jgi:hypothetical protein
MTHTCAQLAMFTCHPHHTQACKAHVGCDRSVGGEQLDMDMGVHTPFPKTLCSPQNPGNWIFSTSELHVVGAAMTAKHGM